MRQHTAATLTHTIVPTFVCLGVMFLISACSDSVAPAPPPPPPPTASVSGTVTDSATGAPIAGAAVMLLRNTGLVVKSTTTRDDGHFELKDVGLGSFTLWSTARGYAPLSTNITVTEGSSTQNLSLPARVDVVELGDFALYVPDTLDYVFGVVLALGDRDTRAFATGGAFGAPDPTVEASLQAMGQALRQLAGRYGLAIIGTSRANMPNSLDSDQLLRRAIDALASPSHHPELPYPSLILYGISGGAPEASGFVARNPSEAGGLFLQLPTGIETLTDANPAVSVPSYMVLAEGDTIVNNAALTAAFEANRKAGGLWALAMEHGVTHDSLSTARRAATTDWIAAIALACLPSSWIYDEENPCTANGGAAGWLGDRATGIAWPWGSYSGDRAAASWLPDEVTAHEWEMLVHAAR